MSLTIRKSWLWAVSVTVPVLMAWSGAAWGETLFVDDFEGGVRADVWGKSYIASSLALLVADGEHAFGAQSAKQVAGQYGNMGTIAGTFRNPGAIAPGWVETATVQFWDDNVQTADFAGALMLANRDNGDYYQLGVYSWAVVTPNRLTNYMWRTYKDGWKATSVVRSVGWHELRVEVYPFTGNAGDVKFYIDGTKVADGRRRETSAGSGVGFDLDQVRLGITATSDNSAFWYDNVTLTYTPEPATMAVFALGSVCVLRRRRMRNGGPKQRL